MLTRLRSVPLSTQHAWLMLGFAVLVLIAVVALSDLQTIYQSDKDFIVGSLLSLVGFCFGKAFSRTQEQKAIEIIRTARDGAVDGVLKEEMSVRLHRDGVFEELSVLARNVDAALERLGEFCDSQCRIPDFYRRARLLQVALDDLDKTGSSVIRLQRYPAPAETRQLGPEEGFPRIVRDSTHPDLRPP
jgi:hypothetical protein